MKSTYFVVVAALLVACGEEKEGKPVALEDARYPTGSTSLLSSQDYTALYNVNPDHGTISRLDILSGTVQETFVGEGPARLARAGSRVFVTLQYERAIAVLEETGAGLQLTDTLPTGAEPYGIVASEDGSRLFVAVSLQNRVDEIDATDLGTVRSFYVHDQPRWLALHPNDEVLYVGSAMRGTLTLVNLRDGSTRNLELPSALESRRDSVLDRTISVSFERRITGDLAIAPDGEDLYVPGLYADDTTTVPPPDEFEDDFGGGGGGYASSADSPRMNPTVVEVPLDSEGMPEPELASPIEASVTVDFNSMDDFSGRASSYPSSVTVSPDGLTLLATLDGSSAVATISRVPVSMASDELQQAKQRAGILEVRSRGLVLTGSAPRGVAFIQEGQAYVYSAFDRTVSNIELSMATPRKNGDLLRTSTIIDAERSVAIAEEVLPAEVVRGRKLFFSADDARMASVGAGVSCGTCHMDGRNDGITWPLDVGPRQTFSLAGSIADTAPFTWGGSVATVSDDVVATSQGRMGGFGLTVEEAGDVAAYIDSIPQPDTAWRGSSDDALVVLGQEVFNRPEVACGTCHAGAALTDNQTHSLFGMNANTPSLRGIAASAPYLHDGSKKSLRDIVENPGMGSTSMLSDTEKDALVRYLESL